MRDPLSAVSTKNFRVLRWISHREDEIEACESAFHIPELERSEIDRWESFLDLGPGLGYRGGNDPKSGLANPNHTGNLSGLVFGGIEADFCKST